MAEHTSDRSATERRIPDPQTRERTANAILSVAVDMHRDEVQSRLGELPAGTDLLDVPGPHQAALRWAHGRAILADTSDGGSYQQLREAEPLVRANPGEPVPFPGGLEPNTPPVQHPRQ